MRINRWTSGAALTRGSLEREDARISLEAPERREAVVGTRARLTAIEQVRDEPDLSRLAQGLERARIDVQEPIERGVVGARAVQPGVVPRTAENVRVLCQQIRSQRAL